MYKKFYYPAVETIITNVKKRFQHKGYEMVTSLENLLLKSAMGEDCPEEFKKVTDFYGSDLEKFLVLNFSLIHFTQ
jgi:hypothetical protein